jgi:hypothetical protein
MQQQGHGKSFDSVQAAEGARSAPQVLDLATLEQISGGGPNGGWATTALGPNGGWLTTAGPNGGWLTAAGPNGGW